MATLTTQSIIAEGLVPTTQAADAAGDAVTADNDVILVVINTAGAGRTVTMVRPGTSIGQPVPDVPIAVADATTAYIAVPAGLADDDGLVAFTYDSEAGLAVAAISR